MLELYHSKEVSSAHCSLVPDFIVFIQCGFGFHPLPVLVDEKQTEVYAHIYGGNTNTTTNPTWAMQLLFQVAKDNKDQHGM